MEKSSMRDGEHAGKRAYKVNATEWIGAQDLNPLKRVDIVLKSGKLAMQVLREAGKLVQHEP